MIRLGLASSALLTQGGDAVIAAARDSGMDAIEWSGGGHVPHNDRRIAEAVLFATLRAGMTVAGYCPLYRATPGVESGIPFAAVLETAAILQAPLVRIFMGGKPGSLRSPGFRSGMVDGLRRLGDSCAARGITLCLSLGRGSCLDDYSAGLGLAVDVAHPFVRLAWEPMPGVGSESASLALEEWGNSVGVIVARSLDVEGKYIGIPGEREAWQRRVAALTSTKANAILGHFLLIGEVSESCGDDSGGSGLNCLREDVKFLRAIVTAAEQNRN